MSGDDLDERVRELERQVTRLHTFEGQIARVAGEALAAHTMAALADRDVADHRHAQRAHTAALNALRETQLEQGQALAEHGQILGALVVEVSGLATRADEHSERLGRLEAGQTRVEERLGGVEGRLGGVEERLGGVESLLGAILARLPEPGE